MPAPTGTITLTLDSGAPFADLNLDGNGDANDAWTVPVSTTVGQHTIVVQYSGDNNNPPGTGQATFTATQGQQSTPVSVTLTPSTVAQGGAMTIAIQVG